MAEIDINSSALKPKSISVDGHSVTNRDIKELKEATALTAQIAMSKKKKLPIRFCKFSPPGCV